MKKKIRKIEKEMAEIFNEYDCCIMPVGDFELTDKDGRTVDYVGLAEDGHIALISGGNPEEDDEWEEIIVSDDDRLAILSEIIELS